MSKKDQKRIIRKSILSALRNNGQRAFRPKELAGQLGYKSNQEYRMFRAALQDLVEKEKVRRVKGNRFIYKSRPVSFAEGVLRVSRDGYGFVQIEGREDDVFVKRSKLNAAMDGDRVKIRISRGRGKDMRTSGEVLEILERGRATLVGVTKKRGGTIFVKPDDTRFAQDVYIHESESAHLSSGTKIVVQLGSYDSFRRAFRASIVEVLGDADDPKVLMEGLIRHFDLPAAFDESVEGEAAAIPEAIPESEYQRRLDLREYPIFTIDPDDAKDYDDAIHVIRKSKHRFEIGVHIADVGYYVKPGSVIDVEASARSTSVYLADRVIPMLPERLSNLLCSLRPDEDKLTFSCIMEVDAEGNLYDFAFHESVIRSRRRFTYGEAQELLDTKGGGHPLAGDVRLAGEIAAGFTRRRFEEGSVEFDVPEVRVRLDEEGMPVAIERKELQASNRLIEEFMLLANQCAARALPDTSGNEFVYRVHDQPDAERIQQLAGYVRTFGLELKLENDNISSKRLNALLQQAKGSPAEPIIKMAALRAMAKASYSPENIGHYGLGFSHYTHFTSPIRRYPDLLVHRLLRSRLLKTEKHTPVDLKALCDHCSQQERAAEEAERESVRQKQILYAQKHLGEEFAGVVTSATRFGLFIEIADIWLEGLVHVRDMQNDYYEYDEKRYALVGEYSGKVYHPGDEVRVTLARANPDTREIDLLLA